MTGLPKVSSNDLLNIKRLTYPGPKQTRKVQPADGGEPLRKIPTYDPKTLLNPKAGGSKPAMAATTNDTDMTGTTNGDENTDGNLENGSGPSLKYGNMIERMHGVTNRQAPIPSKRKSADGAEASDDEHKKQRTTFTGAGRGGTISEHLKQERENAAAANGPQAALIDLTRDQDDDDVVILKESGRSEEVCLGIIEVKVNCSVVPTVSAAAMNRLGKDHWPPTRVKFSRQSDKDHVIHITDQSNKRFGRMEITAAACLVPLLDGAGVSKLRMKANLKSRKRAEGEQAGQPVSQVVGMDLTLYAPRDRADQIGKWLSKKQMYLRNPASVDPTKQLYNPHEVRMDHRPRLYGTVQGSHVSQSTTYITRTAEEMRREANTMFDDLIKNENLPDKEPDPSIIKTPLMSHQKQGLHFLFDHEKQDHTQAEDDTKFSLWKHQIKPSGQQVWYNVITAQEALTKPQSVQGGIFADMMGLGKTLSILALIAATKDDAKAFRQERAPDEVKVQDGRNLKSTLIVCPKSVLSNWEEQIQAHVHNGQLKSYVYHGSSRTQSLKELGKNDVVLTSYGTLATELNASSRKKRALMVANWFRVVLDEAHTIRNSNTAAAKACCALFAQRRWAVTGTPVQNRLEDLAALIKFLKVKPFDEPHQWAQHITAPFKSGNSDVLQHLRLLVDSITLRRMKDKIGLVKRTEKVVRLDFSDSERLLYGAFAARSNMKLQTLVQETKGLRGKSYAHVLKSLLRLRMICDHGREMLNEDDLEEIKGYDESYAIDLGDEPDLVDQQFITERQAYEILQMQCDGDMDRCIRCSKEIVKKKDRAPAEAAYDDDDDNDDDDASASDEDMHEHDAMGYLTPCLHLLHPGCKREHVQQVHPELTADNYHLCPYCETYVRNEFFELTRSGLNGYLKDKANKTRLPKRVNLDPLDYTPHSKVRALIDELQQSALESSRLPPGEPPIRSVVFTEWTSYLDLIEFALEGASIARVRLDGSMTLRARRDVLARFRSDPAVAVLLVSVRAGGQGLNFTAASKVYLMEPQFNPGVEQQAVDRVHRLGQTRDVDITHYIMTGSVEEGLLKLQEKKMKLAQLSMERKRTKEEEAKKRIEELRELFK